MNFESPYYIDEVVYIPEVEKVVVVRIIRFDVRGISFLVSYWIEGKRQEEWLYPDELQERGNRA